MELFIANWKRYYSYILFITILLILVFLELDVWVSVAISGIISTITTVLIDEINVIRCVNGTDIEDLEARVEEIEEKINRIK